MTETLSEQAEAASAELRGMLARTLDLPAERPTRAQSELFEEVWDKYAQAPRCKHLTARPLQPSIMTLPWPLWLCRRCVAAFRDTMRGMTLDPVEESTCDRCRRYTGGTLTLTIIRQDLWLVVMSVCGRCKRDAITAGARELP